MLKARRLLTDLLQSWQIQEEVLGLESKEMMDPLIRDHLEMHHLLFFTSLP
jgi:hypothetical protein